jgi:hypothetical protein
VGPRDPPETPEGPGWRGQPWHRATRPGQELGLRAGNRTGLGDCPSKGRCLSRISGGETQAETFRPISSGNVRTGGERTGKGERDHHTQPEPPCPARLLPRGLVAARRIPKCVELRGTSAYTSAMANIKTRYIQLTKQSKQRRPEKELPKSQAAKEEAELALKIRRRARADYKTVASASSS